MNQETNAGTRQVQPEKAAQNKRSKNTSKNRPVLVTPSSNDLATQDQPRQGAFKTKYLYGMIIYVVVAMFVGQYERAFLVSNHLDKVLFQIGSFAVTTSTALYLLTLIILLIVLARFDLIPRSLGAMSGQSTSQSGRSGQASSQSDNTKNSQPTMKQGV